MEKLRIELELTTQEAAALIDAQRKLYEQRFQTEFWDRRYSLIPHELRHGSILAHCPDMAANKKLLGALRSAGAAGTESAARGI